MELPLDHRLSIGIQNIHRRTEPATEPWRPTIDEMQALVRLVDDCGYDSLWVGDHLAFAVAILDPLVQLAQTAVVSRRLKLGTNVFVAAAPSGTGGEAGRDARPFVRGKADLRGRRRRGIPERIRGLRRAARRAGRAAYGGDPAVAAAVERRAGQL